MALLSPNRDYQLGRQECLRPLMEGGVIPIERGTTSMFWPSRRALVIGCGTFVSLEPIAPSSEDLNDWGMIPPLADRLCAGTVLRLRESAAFDLVEILTKNISAPSTAFSAFGYRLTVSPEALTFVANRYAMVHASAEMLWHSRFLAGSVREARVSGWVADTV